MSFRSKSIKWNWPWVKINRALHTRKYLPLSNDPMCICNYARCCRLPKVVHVFEIREAEHEHREIRTNTKNRRITMHFSKYMLLHTIAAHTFIAQTDINPRPNFQRLGTCAGMQT